MVSTPDAGDSSFVRQRRSIAAGISGLAEREMLVIELIGDEGWASDEGRVDAPDVRRRLNMPADRFEVVLVGKDSGVKARSSQPLPLDKAFALVDAMPMRQQELQERGWRRAG